MKKEKKPNKRKDLLSRFKEIFAPFMHIQIIMHVGPHKLLLTIEDIDYQRVSEIKIPTEQGLLMKLITDSGTILFPPEYTTCMATSYGMSINIKGMHYEIHLPEKPVT